MAGNTRLSAQIMNLQLDSINSLTNSGKLKLYTGTQPVTGGFTISGNTLLATLTLSSIAFGVSDSTSGNGIITAGPITSDTNAAATGTATWFRIFKSDSTTPLWDGNVGIATENLVMNSAAIQAGATVQITGLTHTLPMQGS